jgi:uncharacterized protein (TIGR02118 family)
MILPPQRSEGGDSVPANLVVLYRRPSHPTAFLEHFRTVHAPLVNKFPGLQSWSHGPVSQTLAGSADWFYMALLTFADRAALDRALASPEGRAGGRDVQQFAAGQFDMFVQEVGEA